MTGPRIDLHIDRLVLDGVAVEPADRERFRAGLEAELARLLTERGLPGAVSRDQPGTRASAPVDLRGVPPVVGAARVAQQVYERISGGAES